MICVAQSYNTKKRRVKDTKTETPREVPVHPELLRVLDGWKREGWEKLMGRPPRPSDLIVPSRRGKHRNVNHMGHRLHEDLERLGLRKRNQHDFRRTFISIAQECGANVPLLKWITHGNARSTIMDDYSAISWEARCAEMQKVDIRACVRGQGVAARGWHPERGRRSDHHDSGRGAAAGDWRQLLLQLTTTILAGR
jgi:hypothetical protein